MQLFVDPEPEVLLLFIYVVLRIFITHSFIHAYFMAVLSVCSFSRHYDDFEVSFTIN